MKLSTFTLIVLMLFACKSKKNTVVATDKFEKPVTLGIGDSAVFEDGLVFKLMRVTSDSRCPKGTNCIWAGEVVAVFTANQEEELTISSDPLKNPVKLGVYTIEFNSVAPEKTEAAIANENYKLGFLIKKAAQP
jgi:hypothetical protein